MGNLPGRLTKCWTRGAIRELESLDLQGIATHLQTATNVVVLLGAGASTSCGIPDFRSPGSGLYDNLQKYALPKPEAMFEIGFFQRNPAPFYELVQELWPGKHRPSATHYFVRLLYEKSVLQRCYSQNIDSLESAAGLPPELLVAAHGNMDTCHVAGSSMPVPREEFQAALLEGQAGWERLRAKYRGLVKPNIVFFGENLPERFFDLQNPDLAACDLLIVVGTSLAVAPFNRLVAKVRPDCPRLLVNREKVGLATSEEDYLPGGFRFDESGNKTDVFCPGSCDQVLTQLCKLTGWWEDLHRLQAKADP